ncbi:Hypothetical predicted protein [Octopus vulgaris]|uniref:Protein sleepless n=1 Tax=Octopus vulgaris TaxID=6645 RepID=A0AA36AV72_OCTVU|nr:Hypothetical predicted protein [Octopus vulgaris]
MEYLSSVDKKKIDVDLDMSKVICIQSGFGIKCYECNSFHQQDCGDHFQNTTFRLVTCEGDLCRKIVQTVKIDDKWQARYIRQCAKDGEIGAREGPLPSPISFEI